MRADEFFVSVLQGIGFVVVPLAAFFLLVALCVFIARRVSR